MTREQTKDLLYEEILLYHYPEFRTEYEAKKAKGLSLISHVVNNENAKIVLIMIISSLILLLTTTLIMNDINGNIYYMLSTNN
jgi:uncharacterized membrane protein SpoIIM required for sporulation